MIMVHEVNLEIIKALSKFPEKVLTFDDGLYTQYKYLPELLKLPNKKIFFISGYFTRTGKPNTNFIKCADAHASMDKSYYMSIEEIKEISNSNRCYIGAHGFEHIKILTPLLKIKKGNKIIKNGFKYIKEDIEKMMDWFKKINIHPIYFCYPYNIENPIYKKLITEYFKPENQVGNKREDIYNLLDQVTK